MVLFDYYKSLLEAMEDQLLGFVIQPNTSTLSQRYRDIEREKFQIEEVIFGLARPAKFPGVQIMIPAIMDSYEEMRPGQAHSDPIIFRFWIKTTEKTEFLDKLRIHNYYSDYFYSTSQKQLFNGKINLIEKPLRVNFNLTGNEETYLEFTFTVKIFRMSSR